MVRPLREAFQTLTCRVSSSNPPTSYRSSCGLEHSRPHTFHASELRTMTVEKQKPFTPPFICLGFLFCWGGVWVLRPGLTTGLAGLELVM